MKQEWLNILGIKSEKEINKVNWDEVSRNKKLSESFIEKYSDKLDWYWVS